MNNSADQFESTHSSTSPSRRRIPKRGRTAAAVLMAINAMMISALAILAMDGLGKPDIVPCLLLLWMVLVLTSVASISMNPDCIRFLKSPGGMLFVLCRTIYPEFFGAGILCEVIAQMQVDLRAAHGSKVKYWGIRIGTGLGIAILAVLFLPMAIMNVPIVFVRVVYRTVNKLKGA